MSLIQKVIARSTKRNIRSVQIVMYTSASGRLIRISSRLVLMSKEKLGTTCSVVPIAVPDELSEELPEAVRQLH